MSIARKILMGAAGAGSKTTYVDDVFSTYLYTGTGNAQRIDNGLKLGNANAGNSVYFGGFGDGSDYLQMAHSTDLCFGNGDFTIECWAYAAKHDGWNGIFGNWGGAGSFGYVLETVSGDLEFYWYNAAGSYTLVQGAAVPLGQWSHLCVCRSGNTLRVFVNGTMYGSGVSMTEGIRDGTTDFTIGGRVAGGGWWDGNITNLRITKGQGLYTSNFTPSTEPFTTTSQGATASNVKLLCCNKDTVTGSTVTPGTITAFGSPTASNFGTGTASDGEGGMTWIKSRSLGVSHIINDTVRGAGNRINSNTSNASASSTAFLSSFNNSGFSVGTDNDVSYNGQTFASWSFRKQKGFFDIVQYSGTGSNQTVNHNLGCVPGLIITKRTDSPGDWIVYHRSLGATKALRLDSTDGQATGSSRWNDTAPTATTFSLGSYSHHNASGSTNIAYLFAGGASTAATAKSVDFDGSGDYLSIADSSDFEIDGTNFTLECWFKADDLSGGQAIAGQWQSGGGTQRNFDFYLSGSTLYFENCRGSTNYSISTTVSVGQWYHIAGVLDGTTLKLFVNGNLVGTTTVSGSANNSTANFGIGGYATGTAEEFNGKISNVRFVKGTAVYTTSFKPPTEPLTNITNTKLLCCQSSTVTAATVSPGTITANGDPTASTDSPFDDPEGFKFGEEGDQNLIKCGSYIGASGANTVNLGWEPQWLMVKNVDSIEPWVMVDSMRGWANQSSGAVSLKANSTSNESVYNNWGPSATGWELDLNNAEIDQNEKNYIYIAMRRPDPLVAKPPEVGTDVFAMDVGDNNSTIPEWYSEFPVDFGFFKATAANQDWYLSARLARKMVVYPNTTNNESGYADAVFDSNLGWGKSGSGVYGTAYQSWMWKRYAGMDVVTGLEENNSHNLGKPIEMIWVKRRNNTSDWFCWHKGLNGGGSNAVNYHVRLNTAAAESSISSLCPIGDTLPTATHFKTGSDSDIRNAGSIAFLFASVEGISKVGSYTGNNSSSGPTITTGFSPRFLIIKRANGVDNWFVFDTLRGISNSGNDARLKLDESGAQTTNGEWLSVSSTGFTLKTSDTGVNASSSYIYYAHA